MKWVPSLSDEDRNKYFDMIKKDLLAGGKIFGSKVVNLDSPIKLEDWEKYIIESEKIASEGKLLVSCL
jgi:hypothetical protein